MFTACASAHFAAVLTEYPPSRGNILNQIAKFKGDAYGTDKSVVLLKSLLAAYFLTGVLLLALALGLYKLQLGESAVNMAVTGVYVITCLVGGILAGKASGQHKFLWGLATGVLYFLILLAASFFLNGGLEADVKELLTVLGMCAGSGTIGGMVS